MSQSHQSHTALSLSFSERMVLLAYSCLFYLILPVLFLHWLFNKVLRKADFDQKRLSRFAFYNNDLRPCDLMIHCVSVGETAVAATLVKQLLERQPQLKITLTTTTPTGAKNVSNLLAEKVQHIYLPFDTGWLMSRLLNRLKPKRVLIIEVELWPNLIRQCTKRGIPISVINARMTKNSVKSYLKLSPLVQPMMRGLEKVCAQSRRDYDNYLALGFPEDRLINAGNIKFELAATETPVTHPLVELLNQSTRPILIAGSTHEPEEKVLLDAVKILAKDFPQILLILVPRHPQRFDKVAEILNASKISFSRWSHTNELPSSTSVLLVDEMGLLMSLYACADIAFVGGSIADRGGHNALEPASLELPVIMGPNQYNNPEICKILLENGNLHKVADAADIAQQCQLWFRDEALRQTAGHAGTNVIAQNRGALSNTIAFLGL